MSGARWKFRNLNISALSAMGFYKQFWLLNRLPFVDPKISPALALGTAIQPNEVDGK